jgi:prophage tail gpP-like protein
MAAGGVMSGFAMTANGVRYTGWQNVTVERGLLRCASHFDISVTERLLGEPSVVPLAPFTPIVLTDGTDTLLSGYIDSYETDYTADQHTARLVGRSKTGQLIDCTPDIPAGQFLGYSLAAIATSIGQIFSVPVEVQTNLATTPVADATIERSETAFKFLDRLAAISGTLLCDDENGALIVTQAAQSRASGQLVQGQNILSARMSANGAHRFSTYIVKGQRGIGAAAGASGFTPGAPAAAQASPAVAQVLTQQRAVANDPNVPLYRPHVTIAESQLDQNQMQLRANWQCSYAYGHSLSAVITVPGWRQPDGTLWQINQVIAVQSAFLGLDQDLLVLQVSFRYSLGTGHTTQLTVGPTEGAIPQPDFLTVKVKHGRRKKGGRSAINWNGVAQA